MSKILPCPICFAEKTKFLFEGWDLMFGYPDSAFVYQCRDCEHLFVAGELTPEQLTDMYTNYYPRADFNVEDYEPYKEKSGFLYWLDGEEAHAFRHVPKNVKILDIGCGYCETLGYHKARGCEVWGCEADENSRKIAERYGFNFHVGLFDPNNYEPESFDYVTMDHVLEHIVDPLTFLKGVGMILKHGGTVVAAFPNPKALGRYFFGRYWIPWHLPYHRHFFSRKAIYYLAEQSGFTVETVRSATESFSLFWNWSLLFSGGKRGQRMDPVLQAGERSPMAYKRWDFTFYLCLKKIRLFCFSMRIADMFGRGDNQLLILKKQ